jgi:hypothetical protein
VSSCQVDQPGTAADNEPISISADAYACEAALRMRMEGRSWLVVHDASSRPVGYITTSSLGDILGLVDASAYLGEGLMAAILPPLPDLEQAQS